jgi:hypothetical protein
VTFGKAANSGEDDDKAGIVIERPCVQRTGVAGSIRS